MSASKVELAAALTLCAALIAFGVAFGAPKKTDDPRASTFVDSRGGLHALHLVLEELGAKPRRLLHPTTSADATDHTLVVANPSAPFTKREVDRAVAWVEAGGRLVVLGGPPALGTVTSYATPLFAAFGANEIAARSGGDRFHVADATLGSALGRLEWPATHALSGPDGATTLVSRGPDALDLRVESGDHGGEAVLVVDDKLFTNESLGAFDDAVLAVRLLVARPSDEGRVVFDEFHHGFTDGGGAGDLTSAILAMLVGTWPGRAVLVLALAGMISLAGASVRLGAPERGRPPPRRALSEHADALGRLFEASRGRAVALSILAAGARRATGPRAGIPAGVGAAEFARRLRASASVGAAELADALVAADSARPGKDVQMADLAANLAASKRRYLHGGE